MPLKSLLAIGWFFLQLIVAGQARALPLDAAEVDAFIHYMVTTHRFDAASLRALFAAADGQQKILDAMAKPAEAKPWHEYRPIFLTRERIAAGAAFWNEHREALRRAEEQFGVPAAVIVAIIGVETFYGRITGSYTVLEANATLAFHYPPRANFFRGELEQFLLLAREEQVEPLSLRGSYAGAMGLPQFIASSFRRHAVDFDADGKRDIWHSAADAIGSVANYLAANGWRRAEPIAMPALRRDGDMEALVALGLKPQRTVAELAAGGLVAAGAAVPDATAAVIALDQPTQREYWLGFHNFYVITRYNRSPLYAMAVFQLAEELRQSRELEAR
ncbi:MAG: lytic murein transglycosylase B [Gammaproteobacteria bacterium]|nr:lytic murein transglycosylase B [Gammaproteobacteria bacterium]